MPSKTKDFFEKNKKAILYSTLLFLVFFGVLVWIVVLTTKKKKALDDSEGLPEYDDDVILGLKVVYYSDQRIFSNEVTDTIHVDGSMYWEDIIENIHDKFPDYVKVTKEEDDNGEFYLNFELSKGVEVVFFNEESADLFGFLETKLINNGAAAKHSKIFSASSPRRSKSNEVRNQSSNYKLRRMHNVITLYRSFQNPSRHIYFDCLRQRIVDVTVDEENDLRTVFTSNMKVFQVLKFILKNNLQMQDLYGEVVDDVVSLEFTRKHHLLITFYGDFSPNGAGINGFTAQQVDEMIQGLASEKDTFIAKWEIDKEKSSLHRRVYDITPVNVASRIMLRDFVVNPDKTHIALLVPDATDVFYIYDMDQKSITERSYPSMDGLEFQAISFDVMGEGDSEPKLRVAYKINEGDGQQHTHHISVTGPRLEQQWTTLYNLENVPDQESFEVEKLQTGDNGNDMYIQDRFQAYYKYNGGNQFDQIIPSEKHPVENQFSVIFNQYSSTTQDSVYVSKDDGAYTSASHTISFLDETKEDVVNTDTLPLGIHYTPGTRTMSYGTISTAEKSYGDKASSSNKCYVKIHFRTFLQGQTNVDESVVVHKLHKKNYLSTQSLHMEHVPRVLTKAPFTMSNVSSSRVATANVFDKLLYKEKDADGGFEIASIVPMYVEVRFK